MSSKSHTNKLFSILILAWQCSSHLQLFHKLVVLENFAKFTGKQLCCCVNKIVTFFNKVPLKLLNRYSPNNLNVCPAKHCNYFGKSVGLSTLI